MTPSSFWHPFADMNVVSSQGAFSVARGEGCYVYGVDGRRYLDATASLWYCNVGHGRESIARAAAEQMTTLAAYSTFGDFTNAPVEELAARVAGYAPMDDAAVFFTSGGSDSVDTAVKLVRRYWAAKGQPERTVVISREGSYHGMHIGGTSLAGIAPNRDHHGEFVSDVVRVGRDSVEDLEKAIAGVGAERVAAFFCEPVVGAGGVFHPPPGYLTAVAQVCRDAGVLFVADEVVTGYARLGEWFGCQRYGVVPDLMITAKGLTSGYLPMGALIASAEVAEPFYDGTVGVWRHGYTYSGHATVAAAALANLEIIESEDLCGRSRTAEASLARIMKPLVDHPLVSEVRTGEGLLGAVQIDPAVIEADPGVPAAVVSRMRASGVLSRTLATGAIHVSPPLIITDEQLQELASAISSALDTVSA
jgi:adenosylmethionine-8-amino-7-oxononanoate aminotransferase